MRWIRDIALLLLLASIGAGVLWYQMDRNNHAAELEKATAETQRLEREVRFRAATKAVELNQRGWPLTVDPMWFEGSPPKNVLVGDGARGERPWLEIAPPEDAHLTHPPIRMTLSDDMAGFWYNPYQGVIRARVPVSVSDDAATVMYNTINQVSLGSIHWVEKPPETTKPHANGKDKEAPKKDGDGEGSKVAAKVEESPRASVVVKHHPGPAKGP